MCSIKPINFDWLPINTKVDLEKSIEEYEIIEYDPIDYDTESKEIIISFLSGEKIVIIHKCKDLFIIKKWLNDCINYYNINDDRYEDIYNIELVINSDTKPTKNTFGISLDHIDKITCIIKIKEEVYIPANCTSSHHNDNFPIRKTNITKMGRSCMFGCGILIPNGVRIRHLPENIPYEYIDYFTDIDWYVFKERIKSELKIYDKYMERLNLLSIEDKANSDDYLSFDFCDVDRLERLERL
jgi:hypothetical protein